MKNPQSVENTFNDMNGPVIILGAGESGIGAALLAKQKGYSCFVSDGGKLKEDHRAELIANGIEWEEGKHSIERVLSAALVIKSPGIPEKNELVKKIREKGIPVISEIEWAYRFIGNSKVVAITGSNGKTTTTALTYHICKHAGLNCALVGNIGYSFARQVALNPKAWYIAEISSFQLDDISTFRPYIAILTNITEDHLDRYDYQFRNYINSKFRITMNQQPGDYFIYCEDDEVTVKYIKEFSILSNPLPFSMRKELHPGAFVKDHEMTVAAKDEKFQMSIYDFALKGKHNQYNTMAAGLAASVIGLRKDKIREAIQSFEALEHRMEHVATVRGVEFINDSKATNVNSTWYALESLNQPTILILGGVDKGNDYSLILELVKEKVKAIVCMGTDNRKIHEAFQNDVAVIVNTSSAAEAVHSAYQLANKGDVVLLSPACASFDLFKNYEDRGKQFKDAVKAL
ncbi:UDP-N-acetylmuramoyl-L-alanine--D-glutamate ligase [Flavihumibacter profundi]|uniref:UDP-N-acetylmuramoyl-L-alanine--D-glutamate ligase n=1 Tax=Flavihumibacter profundi TaxID=2716883 RepID=UPI001CC37C2F|nr:UDP-N-acetylmuramoyl-L-alanine--D-glutamate ligase [Flavihumibacter profundi]MBZ5858233.1 UDP-N-acetylmuramoyl-L-alanine--D-glutamate ligase [Flavihumibacter profundi]